MNVNPNHQLSRNTNIEMFQFPTRSQTSLLVLDLEGTGRSTEGNGRSTSNFDGLSSLRVSSGSGLGLLLLKSAKVTQSQFSTLVEDLVVDDCNKRLKDKLNIFLLEACGGLELDKKVPLSDHLRVHKIKEWSINRLFKFEQTKRSLPLS